MWRSGNCRPCPAFRSIAVAPPPTWCLSWRNPSDRPRESPTATGSGTAAKPWAPTHRRTRRSSTRSSAGSAPTIPADTAPRASGIPSYRTPDPSGRTTLPSRNSTTPGPHGSPRHHTQPARRPMCSIPPCTNPTPPTSNNGKGAPVRDVAFHIHYSMPPTIAGNAHSVPSRRKLASVDPDGIEIRRSGQQGTHSDPTPAELRHLTTPPDQGPRRAVSSDRGPPVTCTNPIVSIDLAL